MTSKYSNETPIDKFLEKGNTFPLFTIEDGFPPYGQIGQRYAFYVTGAQTFKTDNANHILADGTTFTPTIQEVKNCIGKKMTLKRNDFSGPVTTRLTLPAGASFNGSANTIATFSDIAESILIFTTVLDPTNGLVYCNVDSSRNVTFS